MEISILKENDTKDQRGASSPYVIKLLHNFSSKLLVETGAGEVSGYGDELFKSAGAKLPIALNV